MPTCRVCDLCGAPFFPIGTAWGDGEMCGHCIADQIELTLTRQLLGHPRKPMRRAASAPFEPSRTEAPHDAVQAMGEVPAQRFG